MTRSRELSSFQRQKVLYVVPQNPKKFVLKYAGKISAPDFWKKVDIKGDYFCKVIYG